ncbi:hypothetical protein KAR91_09130 [Candidatus Pacearchaeota archaeon]|nr:hypothetical protein [Candidatus Pacearchaeota archaeon]
MLSAFDQSVPIANEDGTMTERFRAWVQSATSEINSLPPLTGTGTPESNVEASPGRWYVDTGAAAGTGIYFKETGTGDTGWILRS